MDLWSLFLISCFPIVTGWVTPSLDCSRNTNTRWCQGLVKRGNTFFCKTKSAVTKKVCRKLWCENCPIQYKQAVEDLQQQSLLDRLTEDTKWKDIKKKYKADFDKLGLGQQFEAGNTEAQVPRYEAFLNATDELEEVKKEVGEPIEFEVDYNKFAFMTPEERKGHTGMEIPKTLPKKEVSKTAAKVNQGTDWRKSLQSVKEINDQGFCGCCWAWSASQTMDSAYEVLSGGQRITFSPQDLLDCSSNGINKGCDGGLAHFAFEYIRDNGLMSISDYGYVSFQQKTGKGFCDHNKGKVKSFVEDFDYFYSGDVSVNEAFDSTESDEELMKLLDVMPVAAGIASGRIFLYKKGIYNNKKCLGPLNHAVLIVGYGTSKKGTPYWIIKNTWGSGWGEGGYMRIKRGNYCGVGQYWAYPKNLKLCTKLAQADCKKHPECAWYGDGCDVVPEHCPTYPGKMSCEFYGCYWKSDTSQCLRPTAKCVLDMDLQLEANKDNCTKTPHCEWTKYGNCQVKATTCSNTGIVACESNYCSTDAPTGKCQAWTAYECSIMFKDKASCEAASGSTICQWYGGKCRSKITFCVANTANGENECNDIGCQWKAGACMGKPQSCVAITGTSEGTKENCQGNDLCTWTDGFAICNIKTDVCTEVGKLGQDICTNSGCVWNSGSCSPPTIQGQGICAIYKTQQLCIGNPLCSWYGTACLVNANKCVQITDENQCKNSGCSWFGIRCFTKPESCANTPVEQCVQPECFRSSRLQDPSKAYCDTIFGPRCLYDIGIYNDANPGAKCNGWVFCEWKDLICRSKSVVCNAVTDSATCDLVGCEWISGACKQLTKYPCTKITNKQYCDAIEYGCYWDVDGTCKIK